MYDEFLRLLDQFSSHVYFEGAWRHLVAWNQHQADEAGIKRDRSRGDSRLDGAIRTVDENGNASKLDLAKQYRSFAKVERECFEAIINKWHELSRLHLDFPHVVGPLPNFRTDEPEKYLADGEANRLAYQVAAIAEKVKKLLRAAERTPVTARRVMPNTAISKRRSKAEEN